MRRTENRYKWKTLKHWKTAIELGAVQVKIIDDKGVSDIALELAIRMLENNCFPVTLICCQREGGKKEIWITSLWSAILEFLNNKRDIKVREEKLRFEEMENDAQQKILSAWIESVWLEDEIEQGSDLVG